MTSLAIACACMAACTTTDGVVDADVDLSDADQTGDADARSDADPPPTNEVDLLVVWQDTHGGGMMAEPFLDALGALEVALPTDASLHVGVASSDMGAGMDLWGERCIDGHDGVLLPAWSSGELFAEGGPEVISAHLGEAMVAGDDACGVHMFLDATVRALIDQSVPGQPNEGFLRPDSVLVVLYLGYRDDCSTDDPAILDPLDETLGSYCYRCGVNPDRLRPVLPYAEALRALRPGHSERVVVGGFLGVPVGWDGDLGVPELIPMPNEDPTICFLEEACEGAGSNDFVWSEPTPRLAQLAVEMNAVEEFASLCDRDREALLSRIGQRIVGVMGR